MRQLLLYALCLIAPASAAGQTACLGSHDTNGNGTVDIEDFLSILGVFGDVDSDNDGVWDSLDLCTDPSACNFQSEPTEQCHFYDAIGVCGGNCETDINNDGICDWLCGYPLSYQGYDYETVLIGDQCWFAANLRCELYFNGDSIPKNLSDIEWANTFSGAVGVHGQESSTCYNSQNPNGPDCDEIWSLNEMGRLYNLYAITDARGLCPSGWHVPTDVEWTTLSNELNGPNVAGEKMKSTYGWSSNGNGTNSSGFSGLPGGYRDDDGSFFNLGVGGLWWSSSYNGDYAWYRFLNYNSNSLLVNSTFGRHGLAVRCIQDAE